MPNITEIPDVLISGAGLAFIVDRLIAFAKAIRHEPPKIDESATLENLKSQLERIVSSAELQGDVLREMSASLAVLVDRRPNTIRPFLNAIDKLREKPEIIVIKGEE